MTTFKSQKSKEEEYDVESRARSLICRTYDLQNSVAPPSHPSHSLLLPARYKPQRRGPKCDAYSVQAFFSRSEDTKIQWFSLGNGTPSHSKRNTVSCEKMSSPQVTSPEVCFTVASRNCSISSIRVCIIGREGDVTAVWVRVWFRVPGLG